MKPELTEVSPQQNKDNTKYTTMACEESPELNLLLIGKTGVGKSRTGNSILGKKAFTVSCQTQSETATADFDVRKYKERLIKVVDLPGVCDTDVNEKKGFELAIKEAMLICPEGYDGFLYVRQYCNRFTAEDIKVFEFLKEIFGRDFVKQMFILVLTYGDNFELEHEEDGLTFEHWCQKESGDFRDVMGECGNRIMLFNNATKKEAEKTKQIDELLSFVTAINTKYTDDNFERAKSLQDVEKYKQKKILLKVSLLLDKFKEAMEKFSKDKLQELSSECSQVLLFIEKQDNQTSFSRKIQKKLEDLKESVKKLFGFYFHNQENAMEEIRIIENSIKHEIRELDLIYKESKEQFKQNIFLLVGFALACAVTGVAVASAVGGAVVIAGAAEGVAAVASVGGTAAVAGGVGGTAVVAAGVETAVAAGSAVAAKAAVIAGSVGGVMGSATSTFIGKALGEKINEQ
ncbi:hypothetical protein RRG08_019907 [Elysia crispata]|uniref:AIG1-type G domain-containing protein n=1 Tax=Elysia crispata TaxID=231223 RepID=A0AAE1B831_9GAST|nr:hypothetical protein RRG08_019907 [Elysia crispata]